MHRITGANNNNGHFQGGDPVTGQAATSFTPDWCEAVQEEIAGVVLGAGLTLNPADNSQLLAALDLLYGEAGRTNRNLLINGGFRVWQRNTTFAATAGGLYTADRWRASCGTGGAATVDRQAFTVGQVTVPGEPRFHLRHNQTTGGTSPHLEQRIEYVRTAANRKVAIGVWLKVGTGTIQVTPELHQNFGTGGSSTVISAGSAWTVTTSWQKFTWIPDVPSISGKTISGTEDDYLALRLVLPSSATFTLDVAQVQLELSQFSTSFSEISIEVELALCQRYYEKSYDLATLPGTATTVGALSGHEPGTTTLQSCNRPYAVRKRKAAAVTFYSTQTGASGKVYVESDSADFTVSGIAGGGEGCTGFPSLSGTLTNPDPIYRAHYTADAEL